MALIKCPGAHQVLTILSGGESVLILVNASSQVELKIGVRIVRMSRLALKRIRAIKSPAKGRPTELQS